MSDNGFKLLLVSYYFPPSRVSGSIRTLKFVKYLLRNNWKPTIITSDISDSQEFDESLNQEINQFNLEIIRVEDKKPFKFFLRFDFIRRPRKSIARILNFLSNIFYLPDNKIKWSRNAKLKVEELLRKENFDVMLISCPPFSVFSEITKIKSSIRVPIVVDYRNLWFGSHLINYLTPFHRIRHKKLEYRALKVAEKVIVSNRKIKEKLIRFFPFLTFESVIIIEHGFDAEDFHITKSYPRLRDKLIILHYGDFNSYTSAKYFLKAFNKIKIERPDIAVNIELHFIGDIGKENRRLIRILDLNEFVILHGIVSYRESIYKLSSADVFWFEIDKVKCNDAIVPSKVFYYFATKKPVIGFVSEGAARMLLEHYEASIICDPYSLSEIKSTILKVFELYKNNSLPSASDQNIERFRKDLLSETLLKILQSQIRII